jgi:WD40 repeat protein
MKKSIQWRHGLYWSTVLLLALCLCSTATATQRLSDAITLDESSDLVIWPVFSPDAKLIAGRCVRQIGDLPSEVKIWDSATGKVIKRLRGRFSLGGLTFSADSTWLITLAGKDTVNSWDLKTGRIARTVKVHAELPLALAISPDGKRLATGNCDQTATILDLVTGRETALRGHRDSVYAVTFSHDGQLLASGSRDGVIKLWDVATATELLSLGEFPAAVRSLFIGHDAKLLIAVVVKEDDTSGPRMVIRFRDFNRGIERIQANGFLEAVLRRDDKLVAALSADCKRVQVWDTASWRQEITHQLEPGWLGQALAFTADGNLIVAVRKHGQLKLSRLAVRHESQESGRTK